MFVNRRGRLRPDAESIADRAMALSAEEITRLDERREILRDVLNSFEGRLQDIPVQDRKAIQCLLYKEIADTIFDFRLSLETRLARREIQGAASVAQKMDALNAFQAIMSDVAMIHDE